MKNFLLIDFHEYQDSSSKFNDFYFWDTYNSGGSIRSIPEILEESAEELRNEYLKWTSTLAIDYELGQASFLVKFLGSEILNGGSYWWQTLIADKSPYKSNGIYDVLKLRVLEKLYQEGDYDSLTYKGNDKVIAKVLKKWLSGKGHSFIWTKTSSKSKSLTLSFKSLFKKLPLLFQVIGFLTHFCFTKLRYVSKTKPSQQALCTIVTYFPGIDLNKASSGNFYSNYWGPLQDFLKINKIAVNWVWIHTNLQQLNFRQTIEFQKKINITEEKLNNRYLLVEDSINISTLFRAISEYLKLYFKSFFFYSENKKFVFPSSSLNFYKVLKKDWLDSFRGNSAIINCLHASAFMELGKQLPSETKLVLYIWENQPWEQSVLAMKTALKNAKFVGSLHTPACCAFFNFKGFPGSKNELSLKSYPRPYPDIIAVPSERTKKFMINGGWPEESLLSVEALRYIESLSVIPKHSHKKFNSKFKNLLVVTGSLFSETEFQLNLLFDAEKSGGLEGYTKILIKPHPLVQINKILNKLEFSISYEIVECPLANLWEISDVVFTANSTSVSLEAYYFGKPLIISGAHKNLNLNTLFGIDNISFVHNTSELCKSLRDSNITLNMNKDFFNIDPMLPKWRSIFETQISNNI